MTDRAYQIVNGVEDSSINFKACAVEIRNLFLRLRELAVLSEAGLTDNRQRLPTIRLKGVVIRAVAVDP